MRHGSVQKVTSVLVPLSVFRYAGAVMLSIVTGPFHPDLENALVAEVHSLKQDDPLRPLAIVVPSHQLARRVKWLLSVEQGRALLECHVLTFHQLAMTVLREAGGEALPALVNGPFREELLRYLVDRGVPGAEAFRDRRGMQGLWTGLWATVQDLKEARVDPSAVLQALDEGRLRTDDPARLASLVRLYAAVLEVDRGLRLADPDDLAALAMERVADSAFLNRMARICYYGFYDLTQGQLDFFKAVAGAYPTTLCFPVRPESSAYWFAQRFFETYIQGLAIRVGGGPTQGAPPPPTTSSQGLPHRQRRRRRGRGGGGGQGDSPPDRGLPLRSAGDRRCGADARSLSADSPAHF
jgi:ATP-dependent helicase/nuclease subunit B